jgi:hypothetical protein
VSRTRVLVLAIGVGACGARARPAVDTRATETVKADCGDIVDPNDACPLLDGCPGERRDGGSEDADGCPGPAGIPAATTCLADESRLAAIAREIQKRPRLTMLRIVSSAPGCADQLRKGIERSGDSRAMLVAETRGDPDPCTPWARFEIASWDGQACR